MSNPVAPRHAYPNTYFVQDQENEVELARLQLQDQMLTTSMGGVLSEQPDPTSLQRVLDVGCGTGGWLIEVAKAFPKTVLLTGVDVNQRLLSYAREQAEAQGVSDRVQFRFMDVLGRLQFPDNTFDLVNQRFGASFLRRWDWATCLREYKRVTRPGGVIRITEFDVGESSSSPALLCLSDLFVQALYRAGHFFTREYNGLTSQLARLLHQQEFQNVQTHTWTTEYSAGKPLH